MVCGCYDFDSAVFEQYLDCSYESETETSDCMNSCDDYICFDPLYGWYVEMSCLDIALAYDAGEGSTSTYSSTYIFWGSDGDCGGVSVDWGIVEVYECDDGVDNDLDGGYDYLGACSLSDGVYSCTGSGYYVAEDCSGNCTNVGGTYLSVDVECDSLEDSEGAVCGDSEIEGDEECDDGNVVDGDGCNSICEEEFCGDGTVQEELGEECELPNTVLASCDVYGEDYLQDYCDEECHFADDDCEDDYLGCTSDPECDEVKPELTILNLQEYCDYNCKHHECPNGINTSKTPWECIT